MSFKLCSISLLVVLFQVLDDLGRVASHEGVNCRGDLLKQIALVTLNRFSIGIEILLIQELRHLLMLDNRVLEEAREFELPDAHEPVGRRLCLAPDFLHRDQAELWGLLLFACLHEVQIGKLWLLATFSAQRLSVVEALGEGLGEW